MSDYSEEGKQELAKIHLMFQCKQSLLLFDIQKTENKQNNSLEKVLEPEEISNAERY